MLEFKHPTMTGSLSALDFFRASTLPKSTSSSQAESKLVLARGAAPKTQRAKGIEAAILPAVLFLGTEMFTPAEKEPLEKPSIDVPSIVVTADDGSDQAIELPAS